MRKLALLIGISEYKPEFNPLPSAVMIDNDNRNRLLRGGSWSSLPRDCRSAYRFYFARDFRNDRVGFRVVLVRGRT
ncbi:SUMF1/EgtB/PvdO family nonheme iron enzyme [Nostoc flagelliforme FACHB-838]|uniref:SUMF1/EgtB/PvdO family nonheme iron enzyme n=1 Tax=Nostoc flagelliforme FACHB-838 TaxID=2692904 RepID=A0ABR8DLL6_9NOSO|nr:SUMF1/EgtB/PvdO family nonheme iron enzyme [Nostoc flagelliforme]MBD2529035.1 SUMF1/EgtB/PvdO family nonheme iron enzyme [Nostoc flagelliforme FACHB-838]